MREFGSKLYEAVFNDDMRACLRRSLDQAGQEGKGLRIRLRLTDAPELNDLPWEYLYNPTLNRFLSLSVETPLVRYLDLPERIRPLAVQPPLRALVMISNPSDVATLDVEEEWNRLSGALGDLEERGLAGPGPPGAGHPPRLAAPSCAAPSITSFTISATAPMTRAPRMACCCWRTSRGAAAR